MLCILCIDYKVLIQPALIIEIYVSVARSVIISDLPVTLDGSAISILPEICNGFLVYTVE